MSGLAGAAPTVLVATAIGTALFHTLIPDHWLPFVLIGLARRWSPAKAAFWSGLSAVIHTALSLLLGLVAIAASQGTAMVIGEAFERISGVLLLLFGLGYALYARLKGGHFHVGGERVHRHAPAGGGEDLDEDLIRAGPHERGPLYLAIIIGLNPCVLILPLLMKSPEYGAGAVAATAISYGLATILMMIGLTLFGVASGRRIEMPFLHRYGEIAAGLGIALVGVLFLLLERG